MKRFQAIILSTLLILSALPMSATAAGGDTLKNVALNRAGFSSVYAYFDGTNLYSTDNATDSSTSSQFITTMLNSFYYVDLGAAYTVEKIDLSTPNNFNDCMKVYLSNTRMDMSAATFSLPTDAVLVYTVDSTQEETKPSGNTNNIEISEENKATKYRYVIVQNTGKPGGTQTSFRISDLKVWSYDEEQSYMVEIGAYKPSFAASIYPNTEAAPFQTNFVNDRIIKSSATNIYGTRSVGSLSYQRVVIDLEKEYTIEAVTVRRRKGTDYYGNYQVYATNDTTFNMTNMVEIATVTDPKCTSDARNNFHEAPEAVKASKYRYIVLQCDNTKSLDTDEIGIYTNSTEAVAGSYNKGTRTHLVSKDRPVTARYDNSSTPAQRLTNCFAVQQFASYKSDVTEGNYAFIDLGKPMCIDYLTFGDQNDTNYRYGLKFVATNDPTFAVENDTVIYSESDNAVTWSAFGSSTKSMILIPATEALNGQKYRYVGIRGGVQSGVARLSGNFLDVYTKEANLDETVRSMELTQDGTAFTAKGTEFISVTNQAYTLIGAAYDKDGLLVDVKTKNVKPAQGLMLASWNASVDFADSARKSDIETVDLTVWDSLKTGRPIVNKKSFEQTAYTAVTSTVDATSYHAQLQNAGWAKNPAGSSVSATVFTDGEQSTCYGRGHGGDAAWIDLGKAQQIDAVEVKNNDTVASYPVSGMMFYLTNDEPYESLKANTVSGIFTPPSSWIAVTPNGGHTWTKNGETAFYKLASGGSYRYVVLIDPSVNLSSANGLGVYISEIAAYRASNVFKD